ncbi:uncharacterized protein PHACADRAFT_266503, partial [Phanerochaete carnosa HHB-10118-sp]
MPPNRPIERSLPWNDLRSAGSIKGLSIEETEALRGAIPDAAEHYFPKNAPWSEQSAKDIVAFLEGIAKKLPFLQRYKNAWPAEGCMRRCLTQRRGVMRKTQNQPEPKPSNSVPLRRPTRGLNAAQPAAPRRNRQIPQMPAPVVSPMVHSGAPNGEAFVRAFLLSTHPAMDHLTFVFIHHGVIDGVCLEVLAKRSEKEQKNFLQTDLGLNAMQALVIRRALSEM